MKKHRNIWKSCLLLSVIAVFVLGCFSVSAATKTGFVTENGKTYYINKDGSRQKGWLELNGRKYYFNRTTGVQLKGWAKDSSGKVIRYFTKGAGYMVTGNLKDSKGNIRYFDEKTGLLTRGWRTDAKGYKYYYYSGSGVMATGWVQDKKLQRRYFSKANGRMLTGWVENSAGNYRYFHPTSGILYVGLQKVGEDYYYFSKTTGIRYEKGFGTVGSKKYYFDKKTGKMKTGWLEEDGKKYYFESSGAMVVNDVRAIDGATYKFDENGVASKVDSNYVIDGKYVKVFDAKNNKWYYMEKEFLEHPGIADGTVSDLDLLAAVCDAEAGDQGLVGMEAVALCVLNCTVDKYKEFPSQIRYVVYQGKPNQYAVVIDGALIKRLKGQFEDRTNAYAAAKAAMAMFNDYINKGTARTLPGFKKKDFDYKFFMTPQAFWAQNLNFSKLDYEQYKGHMFFVDWISG
ncbi:cell wall hydrolase [Blautia sp. HCP3S3_C12]|uniref:cell wall hydrolase n=1 Tax=unclassified Blautia TaxID=2648079 RepID=UPI003F8895FA|nr:cell wall hydrolase [Ruminococcus sp.]